VPDPKRPIREADIPQERRGGWLGPGGADLGDVLFDLVLRLPASRAFLEMAKRHLERLRSARRPS
jgi:hypothetical protein